MSAKDVFPFSAVVGQDEARLALLLAAVDPAIGGVLLRGDKGSAKSTLARGLAGLLPDDAPFVELPVGATEDRVLGSLDLRAALSDGADRFRPGLLAAAHGGVLYVDEVNLLPDHLVDGLLDAAASGVNRVERDGVSYEHPARFVLLGSMNPEEGELRPQLLDRFGLSVEVRTPLDPEVRAEAVRRRLAHDAGRPPSSTDAVDRIGDNDGDSALRQRLADVRPADLPDSVIEFAARLAVEVGAESLRADLVLCRAAAALAGWEDRPVATEDDVTRVAPFALGHRRRRRPFDPPTLPSDELASAIDRAGDSNADNRADDDGDNGDDNRDDNDVDKGADRPTPQSPGPTTQRWEDLAPDALSQSPEPFAGLAPPVRRAAGDNGPGRIVGDRRPSGDDPRSLAVLPTVRAALQRRATDPTGALVEADDVREPVRVQRQGRAVVLVLDTSGSMGTAARVSAASGAVLGLLADAYLQRDQVALVAFRGSEATEILPPTASVELARACLADLPTGGATPLADGLALGLQVAQRTAAQGAAPLLVLLSDARATGQPDGLAAARDAATAIATARVDALVLDAEDGRDGPALGLAGDIAERMNARYVHLSELSATTVEQAVRSATAR